MGVINHDKSLQYLYRAIKVSQLVDDMLILICRFLTNTFTIVLLSTYERLTLRFIDRYRVRFTTIGQKNAENRESVMLKLIYK